MAKIERFEDLIAWQKARELTNSIYAMSRDGNLGKDYGLSDQIRRASVSVMSNIAEGFERAGRAEFHRFLVIAKGSCAEVRSQLYVALDARLITAEQFEQTMKLAVETTRIVAGLRKLVGKQSTGN